MVYFVPIRQKAANQQGIFCGIQSQIVICFRLRRDCPVQCVIGPETGIAYIAGDAGTDLVWSMNASIEILNIPAI